MVNQLVLGEAVELTDEPTPGWFAVRAADGYEGHAIAGALKPVTPEDAERWVTAADGYSLGTALRNAARSEHGETRVGEAPWGARLARAEAGGFLLPDGRRAIAARSERILFGPERALGHATDPAAAARTALDWLGAPYVWGGRLPGGTDCSGLVQAVYALHGFRLPRDSRDQHRADAALPPGADPERDGRPGDLWFFAWDGKPVSHVGIRLDDGSMLHSSETRGGVAIDRLGEGAFGRRLADGFAGAVRPAGSGADN